MFYIQQKSLQTLFLTELCLQAGARNSALFCVFRGLLLFYESANGISVEISLHPLQSFCKLSITTIGGG